jgi:hypothetical protein
LSNNNNNNNEQENDNTASVSTPTPDPTSLRPSIRLPPITATATHTTNNNTVTNQAINRDTSRSPSKSDLSKSYRFIERKNSILFCPIGKEDFKKNVDLLALKKLVEEN